MVTKLPVLIQKKKEVAMLISTTAVLVTLSAVATGHGGHRQSPIVGPHKGLWYNTLPGDGDTQVCFIFVYYGSY